MHPRTPSLPIDDATAERLTAFVAAVRSSPHNLLSRRGLEELEQRHVPECLGLAALLPAGGRVVDVGSGGGFPGMVLAIARPDLHVTLIDATAKKVDFLTETATELGVDVETLAGRSEELVRSRAGTTGTVTARAVAPLDRLLPWTLPWLRPGGLLYALKGERWEDELRTALPVLRAAHAAVVDVTEPGAHVSTGSSVWPTGVLPRVVIIRVPG